MIDTNISFRKYDNNTERAAFNIISNPTHGILNGLSIPSGLCLYKNKTNERLFPINSKDDTYTNKCISEDVYSKLFNLACYNPSKTATKTRNLKKHNNIKKKTSYKKK